jgi:hypothetical protein
MSRNSEQRAGADLSGGTTIVVGYFASPADAVMRRMRARSRREPTTLFVNCSGHPIVARGGNVVQLPAVCIRLLLALCCAPGPLSTADLVDALYGDDPMGGPDSAERNVTMAIYSARFAGAALGLVIENQHGVGYRARLCPRPVPPPITD